jgi:hypothetical protein
MTKITKRVNAVLQGLSKKLKKIFRKEKPLEVDFAVAEIKRQFSARNFKVLTQQRHVNVLMACIDPPNFFGGYLAMYNLAKKFADAGYNVRILLIEQKIINPIDLEKIRNHDSTLTKFLSDVEFQTCYDHEQVVPISDQDIFVATSMVSAHIASEAVRQTCYTKFIYMTQDYESIFFDNGHYKVFSEQSYTLDYFPIISTDILQKFYLGKGLLSEKNKGVYFKNPVLRFEPEKDFKRTRNGRKKLLFYARTQAHASRNLYYIGCLAIDRARELGYFQDDEWEVVGIGAGVGTALLPSGIRINHIGKFDMQKYGEVLPQHDLGLSLMLSPHPSLLPIEMASAGLIVVTNTYDLKDQAYFSEISANITAVAPDFRSLADALIEAARRVDDFDARIAGSKVRWPHSWKEAFPSSIIEQAISAVEATIADK